MLLSALRRHWHHRTHCSEHFHGGGPRWMSLWMIVCTVLYKARGICNLLFSTKLSKGDIWNILFYYRSKLLVTRLSLLCNCSFQINRTLLCLWLCSGQTKTVWCLHRTWDKECQWLNTALALTLTTEDESHFLPLCVSVFSLLKREVRQILFTVFSSSSIAWHYNDAICC